MTLNYHWQDERLYFKGLFVPRPEDQMGLIIQMHEDLEHFEKERTLIEICMKYFWHNRTTNVEMVIKLCQQC
jgi:hypothetical protein